MSGEPLMPQPRSQGTEDWERGGGKEKLPYVDISVDEVVREARKKQRGVGL